ncbi:hypothetical protein OS493_011250 [Desmophyllum pertusum]|uniref:Sodefrin-like factor n=1 Tax=Desmophyllum pertusum TaxID=174260 RepID=A0A9W9Z286_9CNID|nr:hypothetical protein OS493_011250 [Desmophyllum pertusum]
MNPAMFFVAALALCALPSALGLMCYKCQVNETSQVLCDTMSQFTSENCTGENNTCSRTAIMNPLLTAMNKVAYQLACVKSPNTCIVQNTTVCTAAISGANGKEPDHYFLHDDMLY